jgi:hypothetical protein
MKFFLVCVLLGCFLPGLSQVRVPVRMIPPPLPEKIDLPFTNIEVIDARFDRSNVGAFWFRNTDEVGVEKLEIRFPDSLKEYLPHIIEPLVKYNDSTNDILVIFVKRFRMVQHVKSYESYPELILNASFSFFTRKGEQYFKLFSVDKLFSAPLELMRRKDLEKVQTQGLGSVFEKILKNKTWITTTPAFTKADFDKAMQQRYDHPILTDDQPVAGCYASFEEFLKNKPSIPNTQPVFEGKRIKGFKTQDGKIISAESCWGASDGKDLFISFRNNFHFMQKADKSFKFYFSRFGERKNKKERLEELWIMDNISRGPVLYHLNMETGTIYMEDIYGTTPLSKFQK